MRPLLPFCAFVVTSLAACVAPDEGEVGDSAQAATDTSSSFAFEPGYERVNQRQASRRADWGEKTSAAQAGLLADGKSKAEAVSVAPALARQKAGFSLVNAKALAKLALLAYEDESTLAAHLGELGLPADELHFKFFENTCTGAQAFYITNASAPTAPETLADAYNKPSSSFAVLAFRGTEPNAVKDIAADANIRPVPTNMGKMHAGFSDRVASLWNKADTKCGPTEPIGSYLRARHSFDGTGRPVRRGAELYITGHSLGGAMANVALTQTVVESCAAKKQSREEACFLSYVPVSGLVTFGSPRVGDMSWAKGMTSYLEDRTAAYRFVNGRDVVTTIPKVGWYHLGNEGDETLYSVLITGSGALSIGRSGDRGESGVGEMLGDHSMVGYEKALAALR